MFISLWIFILLAHPKCHLPRRRPPIEVESSPIYISNDFRKPWKRGWIIVGTSHPLLSHLSKKPSFSILAKGAKSFVWYGKSFSVFWQKLLFLQTCFLGGYCDFRIFGSFSTPQVFILKGVLLKKKWWFQDFECLQNGKIYHYNNNNHSLSCLSSHFLTASLFK